MTNARPRSIQSSALAASSGSVAQASWSYHGREYGAPSAYAADSAKVTRTA
jgi:hypothetical protein